MILSKSKLKLLLFSILTLAIISCGDQSKAKTTSVTVSIDTPKSISRGVLGTYPDITDIILDISDANGKYYAKGRQFTKVTDGVDFAWTTTVDNVPVNLDLNFTASAYDINETKIFKGRTGKTLTLQSAAVFINLFPISDGNAPSIPEITSVSPVSDGVLLHIEDDVSDKVQYQVSPDNFKNSTGTVTIDASGKGTIHLINKDGLFSNIPIYNITLNNHIGGVLETTFAYRQSSDANITIGIAPTVNGIKFKKIGDDKLQVELDVSDDKDILDLSYSWSFNGNSDINIENNAINPIIINNFNDDTQGTLITIVTDKHNLTYTHEYNITANQFKADIEFKVSSTSVDDNKIFVNESIDIIFSKEIREDEINTNSININNGIKSVPGSFTFPSTNKKKVVFTPSTPWKTDKNYNLNITAKVLDTNGHKLIPVVVEFTAHIIDKRSCKEILDSNPGSSDGTYPVDPDGAGGNEAFDVYCDMTTDGGGWTLMGKMSKPTDKTTNWKTISSENINKLKTLNAEFTDGTSWNLMGLTGANNHNYMFLRLNDNKRIIYTKAESVNENQAFACNEKLDELGTSDYRQCTYGGSFFQNTRNTSISMFMIGNNYRDNCGTGSLVYGEYGKSDPCWGSHRVFGSGGMAAFIR